jgi:S1-C subfamily serine protease
MLGTRQNMTLKRPIAPSSSQIAPRSCEFARLRHVKQGVIVIALLTSATSAFAQGRVDDAKLSVGRVAMTQTQFDGSIMLMGTATAFAVAPGFFVTNSHAVSSPNSGSVDIWLVGPTQTQRAAKASIVYNDSRKDLAILSLPDNSFPVLPLATARVSAVSDVYAVGYPGLVDKALGRNADDLMSPTLGDIRQGRISNYLDRAPTGEQFATITHSAHITGGNSGGPLIDSCGRAIGVNTWNDKETQSYAFSIDTSVVIGALQELGVTVTADQNPCVSEGSPAPAPGSPAQITPAPPQAQNQSPRPEQGPRTSNGVLFWVMGAAIAAAAVLIFLPSRLSNMGRKVGQRTKRVRRKTGGRR